MNVTLEDREKILETFRDCRAGLSVTELARKSGINRNKSSIIAEELHKKGVLTLHQQGSSKIFTIKQQSGIHHLIESIPDPALIMDDSFHVVGINKAYTGKYTADSRDLSGLPGDHILHLPYRNLSGELRQFLISGTDGEKKTWYDETGLPVCTGIRISFTGTRPLLIVILHPDPETRQQIRVQELTGKTVTKLGTAVPDMINERTWPEAFACAARIIHATFPDLLIFTLLIDEPQKTCTIHTIHTPDSLAPGIRPDPDQGNPDSRTTTIPDLAIIQYKKGQPFSSFADTPEYLQNTPVPPGIKKICTDTGFSSLSLMGICTDNTLTGILGTGSHRDDRNQAGYVSLLSAVSGYLTLLSTICRLSEESRRITTDYQNHYAEIYSLLTERTQEQTRNHTEKEFIHFILGAVLHTMQISLITATPEGTLVSANKTASDRYSLSEETFISRSPIQEILPSDLADSFITLIAKETGSDDRSPGSYIHEAGGRKIHWYLVRSDPAHQYGLCFFIGEDHPAPLIRYLQSLKKEGVFIPGSGLLL